MVVMCSKGRKLVVRGKFVMSTSRRKCNWIEKKKDITPRALPLSCCASFTFSLVFLFPGRLPHATGHPENQVLEERLPLHHHLPSEAEELPLRRQEDRAPNPLPLPAFPSHSPLRPTLEERRGQARDLLTQSWQLPQASQNLQEEHW